MESNTILVVLVGIIALAMIVQCLCVLIFVLSFRSYFARLETLFTQLAHDIQPVLISARDILVEGRDKVKIISANVIEITEMVKDQVTRLDGLVTEASERARIQLVRIDQLVADTIIRVEDTTEAIQRNVLGPIREIAALLVGLRTGLDVLFRRNKTSVEHATQDEELFI
jgi:ribosomal protein S28E/S33